MIDGNDYLALATADGDGRPWASPVWYAHDDYRTYLWVSRPGARHSRNLAIRRSVGIVVYDSKVRPGEAQAVYIEGDADEVTGDGLRHALDVYSNRSVARGLDEFRLEEIIAPAPLRLYQATAADLWVLGNRHQRIRVRLE